MRFHGNFASCIVVLWQECAIYNVPHSARPGSWEGLFTVLNQTRACECGGRAGETSEDGMSNEDKARGGFAVGSICHCILVAEGEPNPIQFC